MEFYNVIRIKKKISVKSKRKRRDCIFFADQYLMSRWTDKQVLEPNRLAKLIVVTRTCQCVSGQGQGVCSCQVRRRGRRDMLIGTAVSHGLCFIIQDLVTPIFSVLQRCPGFFLQQAKAA